jgi:hypothetical protein
VVEYLLACGVQEDVDEHTEFAEGLDEDNKYFGFTAEDLFDMICTCLVADYDIDIDVNKKTRGEREINSY